MDFKLPKELIAQKPAQPRDHARLLIYNRKTRLITDDMFFNLDSYLPRDTTLVLNNSKVEKARLKFNDNTEIFVVETVNPTTVRALVHPGKKFRLGTTELLDFSFNIVDISPEGLRTIQMDRSINDSSFDKYRLTPFPPYIAQNEKLAQEYQTVYAKPLGSKAAPTAGLHFTPKLLEEIGKKHQIAEVTLHVGLGTFAPLKQQNLDEGRLHEEWYAIDSRAAAILNKAIRITAVGTTTVRTLESAVRRTAKAGQARSERFQVQAGQTDIFIREGFRFQAVDSMITNFHLPGTSLLMMVAAFLDSDADFTDPKDELKRIYEHAIKERYRFYSFGDAMLIV